MAFQFDECWSAVSAFLYRALEDVQGIISNFRKYSLHWMKTFVPANKKRMENYWLNISIAMQTPIKVELKHWNVNMWSDYFGDLERDNQITKI